MLLPMVLLSIIYGCEVWGLEIHVSVVRLILNIIYTCEFWMAKNTFLVWKMMVLKEQASQIIVEAILALMKEKPFFNMTKIKKGQICVLQYLNDYSLHEEGITCSLNNSYTK